MSTRHKEDYKTTSDADTNIPKMDIAIHNRMVFKLSENILPKELHKLKHLLNECPLSPVDIESIETVQDLFTFLINSQFISYGNYVNLIPKLQLLKPVLCEIVNWCTEDIKVKLEQNGEGPVVSMDKPKYTTTEGDAVFLDCTVKPEPEDIRWKRDKSTTPRKTVPIDNRKYCYGPKAPTLVIRDPNKTMDEAYYQCTAKGNGKIFDGEVVYLQVECILVCIDITAAGRQSEPSSVHLAEEFKHYLLDGGTIRLTDESQTVLQVEETSFEITPQNSPGDGSPSVNIIHSEFTVPVGKTAFIQTYVIASPAVTSIQWFKIENDDHIPIEIDNKKYFGGSCLSPTLIIRKTNINDGRQYMCSASNCTGTGSSQISVLSIQSAQELTSITEDFTPQEQDTKTNKDGTDSRKSVCSPLVRTIGKTNCNQQSGRQLELHPYHCDELVCM